MNPNQSWFVCANCNCRGGALFKALAGSVSIFVKSRIQEKHSRYVVYNIRTTRSIQASTKFLATATTKGLFYANYGPEYPPPVLHSSWKEHSFKSFLHLQFDRYLQKVLSPTARDNYRTLIMKRNGCRKTSSDDMQGRIKGNRGKGGELNDR